MADKKLFEGLADRLYFAQHGFAVDKAEDANRPLSEAGIDQTNIIATKLHTAGVSISTIFHSGKCRAEQTARLFANNFTNQAFSVAEHLSPNDDVHLLLPHLKTENALYIGHLPHLGKLISYLVTGDENDNIIRFQNSAIVCLEKNQNRYHVEWYLTPNMKTA
ncbi:MAG: phosphohistidine phosphatase SixA [Gammaproteobacteria bacterium]|nr:MAG: phosphohistidine phosphatase SixA [Gammaproteobacteria bacterium]